MSLYVYIRIKRLKGELLKVEIVLSEGFRMSSWLHNMFMTNVIIDINTKLRKKQICGYKSVIKRSTFHCLPYYDTVLMANLKKNKGKKRKYVLVLEFKREWKGKN